jgi:hypothetical protein
VHYLFGILYPHAVKRPNEIHILETNVPQLAERTATLTVIVVDKRDVEAGGTRCRRSNC